MTHSGNRDHGVTDAMTCATRTTIRPASDHDSDASSSRMLPGPLLRSDRSTSTRMRNSVWATRGSGASRTTMPRPYGADAVKPPRSHQPS